MIKWSLQALPLADFLANLGLGFLQSADHLAESSFTF